VAVVATEGALNVHSRKSESLAVATEGALNVWLLLSTYDDFSTIELAPWLLA
jgi:hypothetical protein